MCHEFIKLKNNLKVKVVKFVMITKSNKNQKNGQ